MAIDPVAGPVLGGVAAGASVRIARKMGEEMRLLEVEEEPLVKILAQIEEHTRALKRALVDSNPLDLQWVEVLFDLNHPIYLEKKGHKYQAIFTPVALTVTFNVMGIGLYLASLPAGWSFTPFPDKTEIWLQTANTNANVMFLATDETIGVAI